MECLLPESLDITTVIDSATQYNKWLENNKTLEIDASQVVRTDAAGLQLLASLFVSAKNNHIAITLAQPTPLLLTSLTTLGLLEQFGDVTCSEG
jgi:ABC-type transporter Mla MlaB component